MQTFLFLFWQEFLGTAQYFIASDQGSLALSQNILFSNVRTALASSVDPLPPVPALVSRRGDPTARRAGVALAVPRVTALTVREVGVVVIGVGWLPACVRLRRRLRWSVGRPGLLPPPVVESAPPPSLVWPGAALDLADPTDVRSPAHQQLAWPKNSQPLSSN